MAGILFDNIKEIILDYLAEAGLEYLDVSIYKVKKVTKIKIVIYEKDTGNIKVDRCAMVSRQIGNTIDEETELENYLLEVSSPGLDRHLKTDKDFAFAVGKEIELYRKESKVRNPVRFVLKKIDNEKLYGEAGDEEVVVDRSNIAKCKLYYDYKKEMKKHV